VKESNYWHFGLLRTGDDRPNTRSNCAAKQRDEFAAL
jgi:hypothetical protein